MKHLLLVFFSLIGFSLNAQSEWQYLPDSPTGGRIDDVFFLNEQRGWCATSDGRIWKTTDGGITWALKYSSNGYFRSIEFLDENIGYAGSLDSKFLRTTDGGDTWTNLAPSITPIPKAVCGIAIPSAEVAYAVGQWDNPAFVLKTTDGGLSWTRQEMGNQAMALVDVFFTHPDTGFVTGQGPSGKAIILYTTDGGQSWTKKFQSESNGQYVWKIQRVTPEFWVGSIQTFNGGKFVKSFDGGQSWAEFTAPIPDMQGIGFSTPEHGWVGGYISGFYETTDGGDTWEFKQFGANFNRFYFLNSNLAYASGAAVYKFTGGAASGTSQPGVEKPYDDGFSLKLSPNPARQFVEVQFELPVRDNIRMGIYKADGSFVQEVYHVWQLPPGSYSFKTDCSALNPGAYFLGVQRNHGLYSRPFSKL